MDFFPTTRNREALERQRMAIVFFGSFIFAGAASYGVATDRMDGRSFISNSSSTRKIPLLFTNITDRWEAAQSAGREGRRASVQFLWQRPKTVTTRRLHKQRHWRHWKLGIAGACRHQSLFSILFCFFQLSESVRSHANSTETKDNSWYCIPFQIKHTWGKQPPPPKKKK